ncbi:MAG: hypothetical protein H6557_08460 [Lewinellaceae bacterium]|nr:hypothetical protein [Phaeodactylibacter sp.]MCB9036635.1 hypothetical protein [Lewinellaceae bacterium]
MPKTTRLLKRPYFEIIYVYGETHQFGEAAKAWSQAPFGEAGLAFSYQKDTLLQIR